MKRTPSIVQLALRGPVIASLILSLSACKGFTFPWAAHPTGDASPQVIPGQANVFMQDNAFHPQKLTVKAGTTIIWVNKDPAFHSVIADDDLFRSGLLAIGQAFSHTFDKAGTYPYYCGVHGGPGGKGMSGEIVVIP